MRLPTILNSSWAGISKGRKVGFRPEADSFSTNASDLVTPDLPDAEETYWLPLCRLVSQLRCWVRLVWREGASTQEGYWGQLLTIAVKGYLEGPGGPIPLRDVEWVEISTNTLKGGLGGRPLLMIDAKDEILAGLGGTSAIWTLRESTWSNERLFENEPVQLIRIANPFRSAAR